VQISVDPEKGQINISLEDGYVSWERTETDYWGHLESITTGHDDEHTDDVKPVPASQITAALAPGRQREPR
jgi:hypothetical protein